jgi:excisionase family DNA binding protein
MPEFLSVEEIARMLGLHEMTVRRHINQGRLKAIRVGRKVRIRKEDLEEFLRASNLPKEEEGTHYAPEQVKAAILAAAGSWREIKADALIKSIYERRRSSAQG